MRERAPWYRRRVGRLGALSVGLIAAAAIVGFATPQDGAWLALQAGLVTAAAAAYLVALVRSPD